MITSGESVDERLSSVLGAEAKTLRQNLKDDHYLKTVVKQWPIKEETDWYHKGIKQPASRYDECVNIGEVRLGKQWHSRTVTCNKFLLRQVIKNQEIS